MVEEVIRRSQGSGGSPEICQTAPYVFFRKRKAPTSLMLVTALSSASALCAAHKSFASPFKSFGTL